jgi:hypothetical protein
MARTSLLTVAPGGLPWEHAEALKQARGRERGSLQVFQEATNEGNRAEELPPETVSMLPLLGQARGLKGGKARAASLSPVKPKGIAKKAAAARWKR